MGGLRELWASWELQRLRGMIDICGDYGEQFHICFNPLKSQTACFRGNPPSHFSLVLNGMTVLITATLSLLYGVVLQNVYSFVCDCMCV